MVSSLGKNVLRANALPDLLQDLNINHEDDSDTEEAEALPFPPLTKQHILNCSYHEWHPKYKAITPKARLIPLTEPFLNYLRADGIILPEDDDDPPVTWSDNDSGVFSSETETDDTDGANEGEADIAAQWRHVHTNIKATIKELGGNVVPKLNWSAPKDATWINAGNSMECRSPGDVYLLLKSSDFVTHDLGHAFDDCVDDGTTPEIYYHLALRKTVQLNPSLEFRCFVRNREILGICQRDQNHFEFLFEMQDKLRERIQDFFQKRLKHTFPDPDFAFDVYIPPPHERVWLIDVNPWALRTDPLLFSWLELLTMPGPSTTSSQTREPEKVRLQIRKEDHAPAESNSPVQEREDGESSDEEEEIWTPEIRLIRSDDPEAYSFSTQKYSAHKLPKDVVDASTGGEGQLREFAQQWKELLEKQKEQAEESEAD
ncbi:gb [Venturia nashicola]|uniref:Gb n=1 Tax=Venturia nashicola TaxID=86259 RepID=A0A4Z1PEZ3_9PEZI|nr:gb [Venturia nashicola]